MALDNTWSWQCCCRNRGDSKIVNEHRPMSVAALSMHVCSRSVALVADSNPAGVVKVLSLVNIWCCARGLCNGPIPRPVESYRTFAGIALSNPAGGKHILSLVNVLFCVGGLCNGPIPLPGKFYRMCVLLSVIQCSIQLLHLRRIDTKAGQKKKIIMHFIDEPN
jgi:hypothetical protein